MAVVWLCTVAGYGMGVCCIHSPRVAYFLTPKIAACVASSDALLTAAVRPCGVCGRGQGADQLLAAVDGRAE